MGFVRPIGARNISVRGGSGILPWEAWQLVTDNTRLSKLWGDHVKFPAKKGGIGLFVDVSRDFQVTWPVEVKELEEASLVRFEVVGNPWHHRPDLVDSIISLTINDGIGLEMNGFDLTHMGDSSFFFASSWALSRLGSIVGALGGDPEQVTGSRSIWAESVFGIQPDQLRSRILDPELAIGWLGDQVDIEARLGGHFNIRWNRSWGATGLEGSIIKFSPEEIAVKIAGNQIGDCCDGVYRFQMIQSGSQTKLVISMDGFDIEPWANIPLMIMSEMIQLQLATLMIELNGQNLDPA
jgi:hypothetical protein